MRKLPKLSVFATVLVLLVASGAHSKDQAQSFDKLGPQRFIWKGTFGLELSRPSPGITHHIVTYLPHSSLVFNHPTLGGPRHIGSKKYRAVVTQFGQQLWILKSEVSKKGFKDVFGTQNVIFNQDGFMCPEENKHCDEVAGEEINRGNVLETVSADTDFYHLRLTEGFGEGEARTKRTREGYLSVSQFNEFERFGVLTDARKQHPAALHFKTKKFDSLATRCGEKWSGRSQSEISQQFKSDAGFDLLNFLSVAFGISATKTDSETIEATYGGDGIATERVEITIRKPDSNGMFSSQPIQPLYLSLEIKCIGSQNDQEAVHIRAVTVRGKETYLGYITSQDIYDLPDKSDTPSDKALSLVYARNGQRPFLLSISTREDYWKAIKLLMQEINIDVSEANILLSELNASCSNKMEGKSTRRETCKEELPPIRSAS